MTEQENLLMSDDIPATTDTCEEAIPTEQTNESLDGISDEASEEVDEKDDSTSKIAELEETIASLKQKISDLEELRAAQNRMLEEVSDFTALFPEISIDSIPDKVWDTVKNGASLAAAYALYEKQREAEAARIALINRENASRSAGKAGKHTSSEYFTPDEVRKMSRAEVHANYSKIKESMKKWI